MLKISLKVVDRNEARSRVAIELTDSEGCTARKEWRTEQLPWVREDTKGAIFDCFGYMIKKSMHEAEIVVAFNDSAENQLFILSAEYRDKDGLKTLDRFIPEFNKAIYASWGISRTLRPAAPALRDILPERKTVAGQSVIPGDPHKRT